MSRLKRRQTLPLFPSRCDGGPSSCVCRTTTSTSLSQIVHYKLWKFKFFMQIEAYIWYISSNMIDHSITWITEHNWTHFPSKVCQIGIFSLLYLFIIVPVDEPFGSFFSLHCLLLTIFQLTLQNKSFNVLLWLKFCLDYSLCYLVSEVWTGVNWINRHIYCSSNCHCPASNMQVHNTILFISDVVLVSKWPEQNKTDLSDCWLSDVIRHNDDRHKSDTVLHKISAVIKWRLQEINTRQWELLKVFIFFVQLLLKILKKASVFVTEFMNQPSTFPLACSQTLQLSIKSRIHNLK